MERIKNLKEYVQSERYRVALAAGCLADIHSIAHKEDNRLIKPDNQLQAILQECEEMFAVYEEADLAVKKKKITSQAAYRCVVNTELNSLIPCRP